MTRLLTDPRAFNYLIMALYALAATRWFFAGRFGDGMYWVSAFMITFTVTFLK